MPNYNRLLKFTPILGALVYTFLCMFEASHQVINLDVRNEVTPIGVRVDLTKSEKQIEYVVPDGRRLNILTLGGSVTWGKALENRHDAYAFRLRDHHFHKVTNLAMSGTGSSYPAQCISTMLEKQSMKELTKYDPNVPFDVIIFEFSINGMSGFQLLFERLKERFPDAFFIYVDMFSLKSPNAGAYDSSYACDLVKENGGEVYFFGNTGFSNAYWDFREEIKDRKHPPDNIRAMFGRDRHHPSPLGHQIITTQVMKIMQQHDFPSQPRLGSWLGGDTCASWTEDGETFMHIHDGGKMNEWDKKNHKFAIEVNRRQGAILQYNHKSDATASVSLQYMTKAKNKDDPSTSLYPPVIVTVEQSGRDIGKKKTAAMHAPNWNWRYLKGWKYITGLHRKIPLRNFHATDFSNVGTLQPGQNFIFVYPVEDGPYEYPFRVTAIIVCEACERLGWNDDFDISTVEQTDGWANDDFDVGKHFNYY